MYFALVSKLSILLYSCYIVYCFLHYGISVLFHLTLLLLLLICCLIVCITVYPVWFGFYGWWRVDVFYASVVLMTWHVHVRGCMIHRVLCIIAQYDSMACSFTSGGRLVIRTRLVPIPVIAMLTIDSTPLWCLYSACPFVSPSRACTYALSIIFMNTCLFIPSIWIMLTVCSGIRRTCWIHSWCHMRWYVDWLARMYTLLYWDVRPFCTDTTLLLSLPYVGHSTLLTSVPFTFDSKVNHSAHNLTGQKLWADWGIEPATFRFVAQHLNHCAIAVPG